MFELCPTCLLSVGVCQLTCRVFLWATFRLIVRCNCTSTTGMKKTRYLPLMLLICRCSSRTQSQGTVQLSCAVLLSCCPLNDVFMTVLPNNFDCVHRIYNISGYGAVNTINVVIRCWYWSDTERSTATYYVPLLPLPQAHGQRPQLAHLICER